MPGVYDGRATQRMSEPRASKCAARSVLSLDDVGFLVVAIVCRIRLGSVGVGSGH